MRLRQFDVVTITYLVLMITISTINYGYCEAKHSEEQSKVKQVLLNYLAGKGTPKITYCYSNEKDNNRECATYEHINKDFSLDWGLVWSFLAAFFTGGILYVTSVQREDNLKTTKEQLRAYPGVRITNYSVIKNRPTDTVPKYACFSVEVTNDGGTPAYDVKHTFLIDGKPMVESGAGILTPKTFLGYGATVDWKLNGYSIEGKITYKDTFGRKWQLNYHRVGSEEKFWVGPNGDSEEEIT